MGLKALLPLFLLLPLAGPAHGDDSDSDSMMKAMAMDAGSKVSPSERKLFQQSIESTKESIARETLDTFYRDALDYYHAAHYDEALELLDKIYGIDPYYEDVGTLRETIGRLKANHDFQSKRGILEEYMRKGNAAQQAGQNIIAVGFWKQALTVNASYEPAKKKIQEVNHALGQKQYEAGYLYYHHGDFEEALDCWSNAIAVDPTYKQRGLLLLMSKVELAMHKDKVTQLSAQASQQYIQKDYPGAMQTYQEILNFDPRNDEARRMLSKIKIQLGLAEFKAAREASSSHLYAQAIKHYQEAIKYGYEVQRCQKGIHDVENQVQSDREAKLRKAAPPAPPPSAAATPPAVAVPAAATNPEEAEAHYREGLAAIRGKDLHRAVEELEMASKLDPNDEHIYVALERAKQEWAGLNSGR